jgi:hypothetical protein
MLGADVAFGESASVLADFQRDMVPGNRSGSSAVSVLSAGVGIDVSEPLYFAFRVNYESLPDSVFAKGAEITGKLRSENWTFGAGLKSLWYSSDRSLSGRRLREKGIPERSLNLNASYRVSSDWSLHGGVTSYHYGGATPAELSEILSTQPGASAGLTSAVEGFPTRSGNFGFGYGFSDRWDVDLSFGRTTYELVPVSTSATLALGYDASTSWNFGFAATALRQDGEKSGSILSLQTTYTWE